MRSLHPREDSVFVFSLQSSLTGVVRARRVPYDPEYLIFLYPWLDDDHFVLFAVFRHGPGQVFVLDSLPRSEASLEKFRVFFSHVAAELNPAQNIVTFHIVQEACVQTNSSDCGVHLLMNILNVKVELPVNGAALRRLTYSRAKGRSAREFRALLKNYAAEGQPLYSGWVRNEPEGTESPLFERKICTAVFGSGPSFMKHYVPISGLRLFKAVTGMHLYWGAFTGEDFDLHLFDVVVVLFPSKDGVFPVSKTFANLLGLFIECSDSDSVCELDSVCDVAFTLFNDTVQEILEKQGRVLVLSETGLFAAKVVETFVEPKLQPKLYASATRGRSDPYRHINTDWLDENRRKLFGTFVLKGGETVSEEKNEVAGAEKPLLGPLINSPLHVSEAVFYCASCSSPLTVKLVGESPLLCQCGCQYLDVANFSNDAGVDCNNHLQVDVPATMPYEVIVEESSIVSVVVQTFFSFPFASAVVKDACRSEECEREDHFCTHRFLRRLCETSVSGKFIVDPDSVNKIQARDPSSTFGGMDDCFNAMQFLINGLHQRCKAFFYTAAPQMVDAAPRAVAATCVVLPQTEGPLALDDYDTMPACISFRCSESLWLHSGSRELSVNVKADDLFFPRCVGEFEYSKKRFLKPKVVPDLVQWKLQAVILRVASTYQAVVLYGDKWYLDDGIKVQVLAKALRTHLRELTNQIVSVFYVPVNRELSSDTQILEPRWWRYGRLLCGHIYSEVCSSKFAKVLAIQSAVFLDGGTCAKFLSEYDGPFHMVGEPLVFSGDLHSIDVLKNFYLNQFSPYVGQALAAGHSLMVVGFNHYAKRNVTYLPLLQVLHWALVVAFGATKLGWDPLKISSSIENLTEELRSELRHIVEMMCGEPARTEPARREPARREEQVMLKTLERVGSVPFVSAPAKDNSRTFAAMIEPTPQVSSIEPDFVSPFRHPSNIFRSRKVDEGPSTIGLGDGRLGTLASAHSGGIRVGFFSSSSKQNAPRVYFAPAVVYKNKVYRIGEVWSGSRRGDDRRGVIIGFLLQNENLSFVIAGLTLSSLVRAEAIPVSELPGKKQQLSHDLAWDDILSRFLEFGSCVETMGTADMHVLGVSQSMRESKEMAELKKDVHSLLLPSMTFINSAVAAKAKLLSDFNALSADLNTQVSEIASLRDEFRNDVVTERNAMQRLRVELVTDFKSLQNLVAELRSTVRAQNDGIQSAGAKRQLRSQGAASEIAVETAKKRRKNYAKILKKRGRHDEAQSDRGKQKIEAPAPVSNAALPPEPISQEQVRVPVHTQTAGVPHIPPSATQAQVGLPSGVPQVPYGTQQNVHHVPVDSRTTGVPGQPILNYTQLDPPLSGTTSNLLNQIPAPVVPQYTQVQVGLPSGVPQGLYGTQPNAHHVPVDSQPNAQPNAHHVVPQYTQVQVGQLYRTHQQLPVSYVTQPYQHQNDEFYHSASGMREMSGLGLRRFSGYDSRTADHLNPERSNDFRSPPPGFASSIRPPSGSYFPDPRTQNDQYNRQAPDPFNRY